MSFQTEITLENRKLGHAAEDTVRIGSEPGLNYITLGLTSEDEKAATQISVRECRHLIDLLQTAARVASEETGESA